MRTYTMRVKYRDWTYTETGMGADAVLVSMTARMKDDTNAVVSWSIYPEAERS